MRTGSPEGSNTTWICAARCVAASASPLATTDLCVATRLRAEQCVPAAERDRLSPRPQRLDRCFVLPRLPNEIYKQALTESIGAIKATPRQEGVTAIRTPGERGQRLREGIEVDRQLHDALAESVRRRNAHSPCRSSGDRLSVGRPWAAQGRWRRALCGPIRVRFAPAAGRGCLGSRPPRTR